MLRTIFFSQVVRCVRWLYHHLPWRTKPIVLIATTTTNTAYYKTRNTILIRHASLRPIYFGKENQNIDTHGTRWLNSCIFFFQCGFSANGCSIQFSHNSFHSLRVIYFFSFLRRQSLAIKKKEAFINIFSVMKLNFHCNTMYFVGRLYAIASGAVWLKIDHKEWGAMRLWCWS